MPTAKAISGLRTSSFSPPPPAASKRNGSLPLSRKATRKTRRRKGRGYRLKQWLFGGERIATGAALFAVEEYKGEIITDLFGDVSCFADRDSFWALQNAAIAGLRDQLVSKGWKVSVLEKGQRFQTWQHVETPKEDGGGAFIEIRGTGEVEVHEGYLARDDSRPRRHGGNAEGEGEEAADKAAKPELTKAAENYLALHRYSIVRAELLSQPGVALRLAVAHMITSSPLWNVKPIHNGPRGKRSRPALRQARLRPPSRPSAMPSCSCWTWRRAIRER
jgi:hypothetical protein